LLLATGVPCVCTPVAAEGLDLPEALCVCIADDAAAICDLHGQETRSEATESARREKTRMIAVS
jgi:hypothetical protein